MRLSRSITPLLLAAATLAGCGGEGDGDGEGAPAPGGVAACVPDEPEGAALFSQSGCLGCHTHAGEGAQNLEAPDLTDVSSTNRGPEWYVDHLEDPPEGHPSFGSLGDEPLLAIGEFLDASRGC